MARESPDFDALLLSQVRLGTVSILATRGATPFSDLRALLSVTQGNLGSHLQKLEEAGYVSTEKSFVDRKPQTLVRLTPAGRAALLRHVKELQRVLRRMG